MHIPHSNQSLLVTSNKGEVDKMNEKLKIENQKAKTQKFIGKTTIELRDAKTGELVHSQEDKNMLTGYLQALHDNCIGTYTYQPDNFAEFVKGVQLLSNQEDEDIHNISRDWTNSTLTGYGNLAVNATQTDTKWMSLNLLETGKTDAGYKWVWDANPNQCNGQIQCINLVGCDLTSANAITPTNMTYVMRKSSNSTTVDNYAYPKFIGKFADTEQNTIFTDLYSGMFSNPIHIDWEKDILYDIEVDAGDNKKLRILRYDMRRNEIGIKYGGTRFKLIDDRTITLTASLNLERTSDGNFSRPYSTKVIGNYLYLVRDGSTTYTETTSTLRIIKINLEDLTYTDTLHSLTQSFNAYRKYRLDYAGQRFYVDFVKDFYPIDNDANVYLWQNKNLLKVNLNDISDVEQIEFISKSTNPTGTVDANQRCINIVTDKFIHFGNFQSRSNPATISNVFTGIVLNINTHAVGMTSSVTQQNNQSISRTTGNYCSSSSGYTSYGNIVFADYTDGIITYFNVVANTGDSRNNQYSADGLMYVEQSYLNNIQLTINNVAPVVKTSDKTMRVIYEITEAD